MKFFRDLSDYLDYELVGAIVASSTPVWIETEDEDTEDVHYQELAPGQIYIQVSVVGCRVTGRRRKSDVRIFLADV